MPAERAILATCLRPLLFRFKLNQINFTMTYQRDSDFFAPYDELVTLRATASDQVPSAMELNVHRVSFQSGTAVRDPAVIKAVTEKSKGVLAVISNCDTDSRREKLIKELRR